VRAADAATGEVVLPPAPPVPPAPAGLPETPSPADNPTTAEKVVLGELLFFDPRLAGDGKLACASCHDPDRGWGDGQARSTTASGKTNRRHTPTLVNVGYEREYFWDGRVDRLEEMIDANWQGQMSADPRKVAAALAGSPIYVAHFKRAFNDAPTPESITWALAAFVRTLRSGDSPWDRHEAGVAGAVTPEVIAGAELFRSKAQCGTCHPPPLYTDHAFHALVGDPARDPGRETATGNPRDRGAFRTPTVRGAADHAPYFHDGSAASLEAAIEVLLTAGVPVPGTPPTPIHLTPDERTQLLAFVRALTPERKPYRRPQLP
jgi:cytochrome c peroxidase